MAEVNGKTNEKGITMNRILITLMCSLTVAACVGCKSTPSAPTASQPVVSDGSKRIFDTSYIPASLWATVAPKGDSFVDRSFVVRELTINGKYVCAVIKDGSAVYYDAHGVEVTGAEKARILAQLQPKN